MRKWIDAFFDVDEPPRQIGPIGYAIMAAFLLFCAVVLFVHDHR